MELQYSESNVLSHCTFKYALCNLTVVSIIVFKYALFMQSVYSDMFLQGWPVDEILDSRTVRGNVRIF